MKSLFIVCAMLFTFRNAEAQAAGDTMRIGNASYIRIHNSSASGIVTAQIVKDSILAVFDTAGLRVDYPVQRWTFSITRKGVYREVKISGNVLPLKCREWVNEQPATGWVCIESVVVLMPDGTERTLAGEKWVKL